MKKIGLMILMMVLSAGALATEPTASEQQTVKSREGLPIKSRDGTVLTHSK